MAIRNNYKTRSNIFYSSIGQYMVPIEISLNRPFIRAKTSGSNHRDVRMHERASAIHAGARGQVLSWKQLAANSR